MTDPSYDFGTTALTKREARNTFLGLASAIVLILVFGVVLAVRFRSSADALAEGAVAADAVAAPAVEARLDSPVTPLIGDSSMGDADSGNADSGNAVVGESAIEELSTARAVLPTPDGVDRLAFGVRVGIFAVPENADRMLVRLQAEGYAPFVVFHRSDARTLRYVYAATAANSAEAEVLAATLRGSLGIATHVEGVDPGS